MVFIMRGGKRYVSTKTHRLEGISKSSSQWMEGEHGGGQQPKIS